LLPRNIFISGLTNTIEKCIIHYEKTKQQNFNYEEGNTFWHIAMGGIFLLYIIALLGNGVLVKVHTQELDTKEITTTHIGVNDPDRSFFDAIMEVESGGNEDAIGDAGNSIGPYQIQYNYWLDSGAPGVWENCKGPGSKIYSELVMERYFNRYATEARLGHKPTYEDLARIHNGGPNGYKKSATIGYWNKVKEIMDND